MFPFDHAKLAGYRALVAVRLTRPADALAAFTESLSAALPAPKQRAVVHACSGNRRLPGLRGGTVTG